MKHKNELKKNLNRIDSKGYKAYKDIRGSYDFENFELIIDRVQGDPYASPSFVRVKVPQDVARFPAELFSNYPRLVALEDFLTREFGYMCSKIAKGRRGSGKSGLLQNDYTGQEILERSAMIVREDFVEARFFVGLPAKGRRILGRQAIDMFFSELPQIVNNSLIYKNLDSILLKKFVETAEDANYIQREMIDSQLVAFVANGSVLPRMSGVDDRPLTGDTVVEFQSPKSLEVSFDLPNAGKIVGMGIPQGVTLIVGGGYHGKSTLLNAIAKGVYWHIPGDGREWVLTDSTAVKVRAEDGRSVVGVDISPFINNLPFATDTESFTTENASGSTSQAANIMEALEVGTKLLLVDEDTSATNFMIRDERMQELVSKAKEPITPFIDKVRQLYDDKNVSTILVMGGSGDYFDVADTVIMMDSYLPHEVTDKAKEIAAHHETRRKAEGGEEFGNIKSRIPLPDGFDPSKGRRKAKIKSRGTDDIRFGRYDIDLSCVEQIVSNSQTRAIGECIYYAMRKNYIDGENSLAKILRKIDDDLLEFGLDVLSRYPVGDKALPRRFEIAAAINRLRSLLIE